MGRVKKMSREQRQARTERRAARRKLRHAKRGIERLARTQAWLDRNGIFGKAEWIDWEATKETGELNFSVDPDEFMAYCEEQRTKLGITDEEMQERVAQAKERLGVDGGDMPSRTEESGETTGDEPDAEAPSEGAGVE